jgi:hypothetical protein
VTATIISATILTLRGANARVCAECLRPITVRALRVCEKDAHGMAVYYFHDAIETGRRDPRMRTRHAGDAEGVVEEGGRQMKRPFAKRERKRPNHTWRGQPIAPEAARFWAKVEKSDGCWTFAPARPNDYGSFYRYRGAKVKAHRYSWELHFGPIPDGLDVCHHCDNPPCVRPDHLFLGTHQDNMRDLQQKGRKLGKGGSLPRTHCIKGHALTPENRSPAFPGCVTCRRERDRGNYLKRKAARTKIDREDEIRGCAPDTPETRAVLAPRRAVNA